MWDLIEADLHSEYGIDVASGILADRSWPWLRLRILGLPAANTRTARALLPRRKRDVTGQSRRRGR